MVSDRDPAASARTLASASAFAPGTKLPKSGSARDEISSGSCRMSAPAAHLSLICHSFSKQRAAEIRGAQLAQADEQHRARRQREQYAEEAEDLAEGEQREDHGHRMEPDPAADDQRRDGHSLERLADADRDPDPDHAHQAIELQQGGGGRGEPG